MIFVATNQYIIGISAHANHDDAERGRKIGMNMHLPKPILLKQLKDIVQSEEVVANMKVLDRLSRNSDMRPFCLFTDDLEVTETDEGSSATLSDVEGSQRHFTCLIAEGLSVVIKTLSRCIERRGWRIRVVKNGVDALKMMQMRNWDAIFIDENLPSLSGDTCISIFRKWEAENRVARQRNIIMISALFNDSKKISAPSDCDGVIGTHFSQDEIISVLDGAELVQKKPSPL